MRPPRRGATPAYRARAMGLCLPGLDRLQYLGSARIRSKARQAPGCARTLPRLPFRTRRVLDDEVERPGIRLAQAARVVRELGERVGVGKVDGEEPVPARGPPHGAAVRPARR